MELLVIKKKIYEIRGHRVMLDFDLAELYAVETKRLKEAVRRNRIRFPDDFMFELSPKEFENLRSQIASSNRGGARYMPFAFTEQGVAMLSAVLSSPKAINVNISIMRAFVMMRELSYNYKELADKTALLEHKYNKKFADVYEALTLLIEDKEAQSDLAKRKRIGYKIPKR
jgi:hypothetical protein